ncbi:hypothetical protein GGS24DRAFT_512297 [Hypoxylon argillaceum]|nr:hypothetical protein GGS24DRAFT_512297 [Hypoxylon argillaceum]
MDYYFDGYGLLREQSQPKSEAAALAGQLDGDSSLHETAHTKSPRPSSTCEWRGDPPEPELDDLAHPPEQTQQPSRSADVCDWQGDEPEQQEDDLGEICPPDKQTQQPSHQGKPVEEADSIHMPIPRPPKVMGIPEIIFPLNNDNDAGPKHDPKPFPVLEPQVQNGQQSERGKKPKRKKERAGNTAGHSNALPDEKTHSPWVDSLEHMSTAVRDRVNMGVKQTLDAATNILTPSAYKKSPSPGPTVTKESRRNSALAPASAAPPPSDFYIPRPAHSDITQGESKKEERERIRSEKKSQRDTRRRAKQEKNKERKEKRRENKERRRKEKEWKRTAKKGGELPAQIRQGLRNDTGIKIPYNPRCDICTKSAATAMSSKKHNPKCTICAKEAERNSTNQYLKSLKISLADLPSVDDLLDDIKKLVGKEKKSARGASTNDQANADDELARHVALHVQDLTTSGGEASSRGHKCNNKGQPGHLGRHGLDGNRDSPTATDGGQLVSASHSNSGLTTTPIPSEIDWWVQALSSKESPSSRYRSNSPPPFAITPLPR